MFDLAWSEIALIGVVALIAIGPKDLPVAIKAVAEMMKKARRMASEFQGHVDEMVREANLHDVRDQFNDIRNLDIKGKILNAVDSDGSLQRTVNSSLNTPPYTPPPAPLPEVTVPAHEPQGTPDALAGLAHVPEPTAPAAPAPPAMIPPDVVPTAPAPAFIPPAEAVRPAPHA